MSDRGLVRRYPSAPALFADTQVASLCIYYSCCEVQSQTRSVSGHRFGKPSETLSIFIEKMAFTTGGVMMRKCSLLISITRFTTTCSSPETESLWKSLLHVICTPIGRTTGAGRLML